MKANELKVTDLMVGDWVSCQINGIEVKYVRIASLNKTTMNGIPSDFIEFNKVTIDMLHGNYYQVDVASIHPIPLTPEILKKNGISYEKQSYYYVIKDDKDLECTYYIQQILQEDWAIGVDIGAYDCSVFARVKYVHQLQHALRLCGINKDIVL